MTTTVAIVGHNGNVGKRVLPLLIKAHQDGHIKLIVLHRPASKTDGIPSDIEARIVDADDLSETKKAVQGINVLLSTIAPEGFGLQVHLLDALAGSPDIVTFIPATFGAVWTDDMLRKPAVRAFHEAYEALASKAQANGVGFTEIRAGLFLDYTFVSGFMGLDAKANAIQMYKDALTKPLHISELGHLADAIVNVILREPASIKNRNYYTYTFSPTGQDLIDLFTAKNGSAPKVTDYTDAQYEQDTDEPGMAMVAATYHKRWGGGDWAWDSIKAERVNVPAPTVSLADASESAFAK